MFLLPSEVGFLRYLKEAKVPLNEFSFPPEKIANVQSQVRIPSLLIDEATQCSRRQLEKLLQKNYFLHQSAKDGYRSYLQAYASYSLKKIFDVNQLDLAKVGKAFGFAVPPRVNVNIGGGKGGTGRAGKRKRGDGEDEEEWEEINAVDKEEGDNDAEEEQHTRRNAWEQSKSRRKETLGRKTLEKEVYKKGVEMKKMKAGGWSR